MEYILTYSINECIFYTEITHFINSLSLKGFQQN